MITMTTPTSQPSFFGTIIRFLSFGKYRSLLYHHGSSKHSSLCSGLLTIVFTLFIAIYGLVILVDIFKMQSHSSR
jgi:hypothetical protein